MSVGGIEYELVASKLAERIYGDRFRNDTSALGESGVMNAVFDEDGKPTGETYQVTYSGRLKLDIAISAGAPVGPTAEIPDQVAERAFFRDLGRSRNAEEPDQSEEG